MGSKNWFVWVVIFYIFLIYTSLWLLVFFQWENWIYEDGFYHSIIFHISLGMMLYNYQQSIFLDPGYVPSGWEPDYISKSELERLKKEVNGMAKPTSSNTRRRMGVRWCWKCKQFKPPRAHHCSECKRCVLRMDHHCPWINNCVGHFNHKSFLLFLFYTIICATYSSIWMLLRMTELLLEGTDKNSTPITIFSTQHSFTIPVTAQSAFLCLMSVVLIPITISIICLCVFQLSLISSNTTNIESYEVHWAKREARRKRKPYFYPYNLGIIGNFRQFLGSSLLVWFFPSQIEGNGYQWSFNPHWLFDDPPVDQDDQSQSTNDIEQGYARNEDPDYRKENPMVSTSYGGSSSSDGSTGGGISVSSSRNEIEELEIEKKTVYLGGIGGGIGGGASAGIEDDEIYMEGVMRGSGGVGGGSEIIGGGGSSGGNSNIRSRTEPVVRSFEGFV